MRALFRVCLLAGMTGIGALALSSAETQDAQAAQSFRYERTRLIDFTLLKDGGVRLEIGRGSDHGIFVNSTGMIYLGKATNKFLQTNGENVRFRVTRVSRDRSTAEVFQGKPTADELNKNQRVVLRANQVSAGKSSTKASAPPKSSLELGSCQPTRPRSSGHTSSCSSYKKNGEKYELCARFDPSRPETLKSNLCLAQASNASLRDANGKPVNYSLFGKTDCRTSRGTRGLKSIDRVVIHNGGYTAQHNTNTWDCRPASSHYSIDRQGGINQHIGEELTAWHTKGTNSRSIGIELNIDKYKGKSCNRLSSSTPRDIFIKTCEPTAAQYQSLRLLLRAIAARTSVVYDEQHVAGHCELVSSSGHHDPSAFNWNQIGLSNIDKNKAAKGHPCRTYNLFPIDGPLYRGMR